MIKISIITPCRNAANYIRETVESVLAQSALSSGRAELEYIICDGLSSDGTAEIAESVARSYRHGTIKVLRRQDTGMYDALGYGFRIASGDVCAYINAGDYYSRHAFDIVLDLFRDKHVKWLTGFSTVYNEHSHLVEFYLPYKYRARLFACGCYGTLLPTVQQESTFWNAELNAALDYEALAKLKYAGDYYLWHQFSQHADLNIVAAYLGGFKRHHGQLSENNRTYLDELAQIINDRKPGILDRVLAGFDSFMWKLPPVIKKRFNPQGLYCYDHERQEWT